MNRPVAIIVPFKDWNEWVWECVRHCAALTGPPWVLWLLPDAPPSPEWVAKLATLGLGERLRIEPTGPGNPARKRNIALDRSGAEIFALLDSDAYAPPGWLATALARLEGDIAIVTGPNLTPPDDPLRRRVPGRVMESPLGFGAAYIRHVRVGRRFVREMPTCNMLARRLPGLRFREELDTGEDMMYCADVRARGGRILYDPEVPVFHHRRALFRPFMRQFYNYGYDKGALARGGHEITYVWQALPALFTLYLLALVAALLLPLPATWRWVAAIPLAVYAAAIIVESARVAHSLAELWLVPIGFLLGHLSYGLGYLRGFITGRTRAGTPGPLPRAVSQF